jgi:hypothetical protein
MAKRQLSGASGTSDNRPVYRFSLAYTIVLYGLGWSAKAPATPGIVIRAEMPVEANWGECNNTKPALIPYQINQLLRCLPMADLARCHLGRRNFLRTSSGGTYPYRTRRHTLRQFGLRQL